MSQKKLYTTDYELHASVRMLFPYISSATGLSEWFADDVTISPEKVFTFHWDHEKQQAILVSHRTNHFARFEFLPETEDDKKDPSYFEIRLEADELTQTTFLKIFDYSDLNDDTESKELWDGLITRLKGVVGG
ncbi:MAG: ATPase [Cyclobacteriaceae bacterium]|nr:ATPase [Cyclobacteriaceae bacterium]